MTYYKHPDLSFGAAIKREILFAAEDKSKTCDLTLALLQIIKGIPDYEEKIERLEDEKSGIESEYDQQLKDQKEEFEEKLDAAKKVIDGLQKLKYS